jgi:hypothetical protein
MAQYKIVSKRTSLGEVGSIVSAHALNGLNIDALVDSGHLEVVTNKISKADFKESDK